MENIFCFKKLLVIFESLYLTRAITGNDIGNDSGNDSGRMGFRLFLTKVTNYVIRTLGKKLIRTLLSLSMKRRKICRKEKNISSSFISPVRFSFHFSFIFIFYLNYFYRFHHVFVEKEVRL